jgi:hypothetical protein
MHLIEQFFTDSIRIKCHDYAIFVQSFTSSSRDKFRSCNISFSVPKKGANQTARSEDCKAGYCNTSNFILMVSTVRAAMWERAVLYSRRICFDRSLRRFD